MRILRTLPLEVKEILTVCASLSLFFWRDDDDDEKKGKISIVLHTAKETQEKLFHLLDFLLTKKKNLVKSFS